MLVYTFDNRVPFANILINKSVYDSGVTSIDKLAGKSVGITAPQSATWLMAVYITERAGLKDKVAIRPLGDFTTMMAAVKSKGVDACMATYAMLEKAKEEGWGVPLFEITDAAAWDKVFGGSCRVRPLMFWKIRSRSVRRDVQALVTGLCKGTDFVFANSAENDHRPDPRRLSAGLFRPSVIAAINTFKNVWSKDNMIPEPMYARLAAIMGSGRQYSDAEMATATYAKNVDMSFVRKASGIS